MTRLEQKLKNYSNGSVMIKKKKRKSRTIST